VGVELSPAARRHAVTNKAIKTTEQVEFRTA